MILTGKKLEEIGLAVWGPTWADRLAEKLDRVPKTLYRWRDTAPPAEARAAIEAAVEDQLVLVARYHDELRSVTLDG